MKDLIKAAYRGIGRIMTDNTADITSKAKSSLGQRIWSEVKFFLGLASFMLVFLTFVWGHYKIPSESMLPTLEVGDHLYVSKFAYGFSRHSPPFGLHKLPFLGGGKIMSKLPERGDVAVFRNPRNDLVMIKRVAGLPGDKIRVHRGRLFINGVLVQRDAVDNYLYREHRGRKIGVDVYREKWMGEEGDHLIYEQIDTAPLDNTKEFVVPPETLFFMGDNRDNSTDSRATLGPGYVPLTHLIGRAEYMMFSFKRCAKEPELRCPPRRFMQKL